MMPDEFLCLDGNCLSTDDLLQLGKGRYKIKVGLSKMTSRMKIKTHPQCVYQGFRLRKCERNFLSIAFVLRVFLLFSIGTPDLI